MRTLFLAGVALCSAVQAQAASSSGPGSLDATFGTNGVATITVANAGIGPTAAIEQSSGDIVVVGGIVPTNTSSLVESVFIARVNSSGKLDKTFGTNGMTTTSISGSTIAPIGAGTLPNGDILVGAVSATVAPNSSGVNPVTFVLVAYTANGALDTTFGSNGVVTTAVGSQNETGGVLLVQPNGQIVIAANEPGLSRTQAPRTVLIRYNSNGSLDTTFGSGGIVQVATVVAPGPGTLALLANGDYLALVPSEAEFSSTGALVSTFTASDVTAMSGPSITLLQSNGDFVQASTVGPPSSATAAAMLARANVVRNPASDVEITRSIESGAGDSTFTTTTFSFVSPTTTSSNESSATLLAFSSSGQIIAAGRLAGSASGSPILIGLARLDADGGLDTTFGSGGVVTNPGGESALGLLIQNDGNIVVLSETASDNGTASLVLVRFLAAE